MLIKKKRCIERSDFSERQFYFRPIWLDKLHVDKILGSFGQIAKISDSKVICTLKGRNFFVGSRILLIS